MVEHALVAGEAERVEDLVDDFGAVLRNDADGIAGRIGYALLQREGEVARLLLGALAAEKAIDQHGRVVWIVARVPGTQRGIRGRLIGGWRRLLKLIHGFIVTRRRGCFLPRY